MNVVIFGATGMIGHGALRECLLDPDVERVVVVGRSPVGQTHAKLAEIVRDDLFDLAPVADQLKDLHACLFCLGVSAAGMNEQAYRRVTHDLTLAVAHALLKTNPDMTFVYVSGAGTDAKGRAMWARVKGETEDELLQLPFKDAYMFRPAGIQPLHGARSKTPQYQAVYSALGWAMPLMVKLFPAYVTTTEALARAMLAVCKRGAPTRVLEGKDIHELAASPAA